jgi:hypothetical protein
VRPRTQAIEWVRGEDLKKILFASLCLILPASALFADVALTDKGATMRAMARSADALSAIHKVANITPAEKAAIRAANAAKRAAKRARQHSHGGGRIVPSAIRIAPNATGSVGLIDASGLKFFINTNITFSTSSSASAAASEASYTHSVAATTLNGGTTMSTLNDMYDGYNAMCVSLTGATGPCATGNANFTMYNKNGPASIDATVPVSAACTGRQYVFNPQTIGGLSVSRKVYVPNNDTYARWMNIFTNTSGSPITFNMITSNNLGSDSNTQLTGSSSGDNVATTADLWVSSFQAYSGTTSSDVRNGNVLQGQGALTPVSFINFVNGDDNPWWTYSITLAPGQTKIIVNYSTGQPSNAAAKTKAAQLATFGPNAQQCMSVTELAEVVNFAPVGSLPAMSTWMLALLGLSLAGAATVLLGRQS